MIVQHSLAVATAGRGIVDITDRVNSVAAGSGIADGLCHVFVKHTSASLLISENADPDVLKDLETFMARLVPEGDPDFLHMAEGADDMPAHIRSVLTQTGLSVPVSDGRCNLGTWQGIYLWEHRTRAHTRHVVVTVLG